MKVVITGVNGFIGSQLAMSILKSDDSAQVIGVFQATSSLDCNAKLERLKEHWQRFCGFVVGDRRFCAISWDDFQSGRLPTVECEYVFHTAAATDFDQSIQLARKNNVQLTLKALMGARHLVNLKRFVHVSTAFVLARMSGDTDERSIPVDFNNTYEQTKYESELAVRVSNIPYTIARPSIVVGDSTNGYAKHFRVFYSMFRLWLTGVVPRAPLDLKAQADVVPIDFVCEMLRNIAEDHRALGATVHVCSGRKSPMVSEIFLTGIDVFGQKRPRFSPPAVLRILGHPLFARLVPDALFEVLRVLRGHFPYLGSRTRHFSTHLLETWYADKGRAPEFKDYGVKLFQYCKNTRWGKLPLHQWRNECGST